MNYFYCSEINGKTAILNAVESAHCVRVLRMRKGDHIHIIDGIGGLYNAIIVLPDAKACVIEIVNSIDHQQKRDFRLHIAIAPTKSMERFEWFLEKSVEIGIDVITPLLCERSERKIIKTERLEKVMVSSMKQAIVLHKPKVNELIDFNAFIKKYKDEPFNRYIAHCEKTTRKQFHDVVNPKKNTIILIGPEGDFSPGEIKMAGENGFMPVTFGQNRYRTETAAIFACSIFNFINS